MANIILEIPDVKGECTLEGYKEMIDCTSFSQSCAQEMDSSKNATRSISSIKVEEVNLERYFDKASTVLLDRLVAGKNCGTCHIHFLKAAGTDGMSHVEFMTITMENTMVSTWEMSDSSDDPPTETITLNFSKITWKYAPQKVDGTLDGTIDTNFNLALGKKE